MVDTLPLVLERVRSLITVDPMAAAILGTVAVIFLATLAYLLWSWRHLPPGKRFCSLLEQQDRVLVLLHPNPDPDAMAGALGVQELGERLDTTVDVSYPGRIAHQENRAFRTVLGVDFDRIETAETVKSAPVILLDHNVARGFDGADDIEPVAVVDHHPGNGTGTEFTDVRETYGATATIVTEYLRDTGIDYDQKSLPTHVATGLMYGILSDTDHLVSNGTDPDFAAAAYLSEAVDENALNRIANPPVDATILDTVARAIRNREVRGPFAVSDVGEIDNPDSIPQAADKLRNLEGATVVIVFGIYDNEIKLSGRSRDDRVNIGDALSALAAKLSGDGKLAGGHSRMGGGQIPIESIDGASEGDLPAITDEVFDIVGGAHEGEAESAPPVNRKSVE